MTYLWKGEQYVGIAAGGHSEAGTSIGDSLVAFRLARAGETSSLWSAAGSITQSPRSPLMTLLLFVAWTFLRRTRCKRNGGASGSLRATGRHLPGAYCSRTSTRELGSWVLAHFRG